MAGIPVHSSSPINPNAIKATGATPSTADAQDGLVNVTNQSGPAFNPAATTTAMPSHAVAAQPGASSFPAPTGRPRAPSIPQPTSTTNLPPSQRSDAPPPPQPGAIPSAHPTPQRPSIPPPPKASETPQPAAYYAPQPTQPAPTSAYNSPAPLPSHQQYPNISTPSRAQPPASITSTPHDLSHPPGYLQDTRASFDQRPIDPYRPFESMTSHNSTPTRNGGILDNSPGNQGYQEEKGLWDTAVSWAKTAGEKLSKGEQEVWKAINREK